MQEDALLAYSIQQSNRKSEGIAKAMFCICRMYIYINHKGYMS